MIRYCKALRQRQVPRTVVRRAVQKREETFLHQTSEMAAPCPTIDRAPDRCVARRPRAHASVTKQLSTSAYILRQVYLAGQPQKVHLGQARRIEFSYRNIREEWARTQGRAWGAVPQAPPFVRAHASRIFLYGNSILHAWVCAECKSVDTWFRSRRHACTHARSSSCCCC